MKNVYFFVDVEGTKSMRQMINSKRDANPQMQKPMFILTDGQHMETLIGSVV